MGYCANGSGSATYKDGVTNEQVKSAIEKAFAGRSAWCMDYDADGKDISFWDDDKYHAEDTEEFLNVIKPFIKDGSMEYTGEDGEKWRFIYNSKEDAWNEESGTVVYGEDFSPLSDELLMKEMKKRGLLSKKVPLVTTYSFDQDTPVFLYDTQEEAAAELKRQFNEELRIQTEEIGHVEGTDLEIKFSDDKLYASITIYYDDQKDVIEWSVGDIKN